MKEKQSNYRIIENVIDTANGEVKIYHIQKQYKIWKFQFWRNYFPLVQDYDYNSQLRKIPSLKLVNGQICHWYNKLSTVEYIVNYLENNENNHKYSGIKIIPYFASNNSEVKTRYFIKKYSKKEGKLINPDRTFIEFSHAKSYIDSKMKTAKKNIIRTSVFEIKTI